MTVSFASIPSGLRVPGSYVEVSGARAITGLPAASNRVLLVGQRLASGIVPALVKQRVTTIAEGALYFGLGSALARMISAALTACPNVEIWAIAVDDAPGSTAYVQPITVTGTATAAGTVGLMLSEFPLTVDVVAGTTAATVATAIAAAINARPEFPFTATSAGGVVTTTLRNKGASMSSNRLLNYYPNQSTPAGLTVAFSVTAGSVNPDITSVFAVLGDDQFQSIAVGWWDATTMAALDAELASRWGPMRQIEGRAFVGNAASFANATSQGSSYNSPHTSYLVTSGMPNAPYQLSAAVAAIAAYNFQIDPARPLTNLPITGILPPIPNKRWTRQERDLLLKDGVSTWRVDHSGTMLIERLISTYQVDTSGSEDPTWIDATTTATVAYFRQSIRARIADKFPRHKLASDDARFSTGQAIATPSVVRAELIALAREWEEAGLVEDMAGFIASLIVERDAGNPNQLNILASPNIVNGLLQTAVRIEFIL